ncbi:hypothetical protein [Undibacterium sp. Di24W]|uniref:hypothetical protein n=1 Tax=Undibacterium sp. Di24W TaxID=3413033 RepID=UPI003BF2E113
MKNFDEIDLVLKPHNQALKRELQSLQAPASVEQALLAAFDQHFPKRPWYQRWQEFSWQLTTGLCVSLVALVLVFNQTSPLAPKANQDAIADNSELQANDEMHEEIPFLALNSGEEILRQDDMRIVKAQIPHSVLATLGVTVNPEVANQSSKAEVLLGANDEFLAVRFLPN